MGAGRCVEMEVGVGWGGWVFEDVRDIYIKGGKIAGRRGKMKRSCSYC